MGFIFLGCFVWQVPFCGPFLACDGFFPPDTLFSFNNAWTLAVGFVILMLFGMLLSRYARGLAGWVGLKLFDDALLL
ncbi:hypothetical protein D5086_021839 [Populus alba]|uniref:Uncharacterized protein n=1 Tax=Populus alba TaxID=43335 RepID=A0ACC4BDU7_POPAL